jgi:hypothetical protein
MVIAVLGHSSLHFSMSARVRVGSHVGALAIALQLAACLCSAEDAQGLTPAGKPALEKPKALAKVVFKEGEKGDPQDLGCADGQREGFADAQAFPNIAGCLGTWKGDGDLRDAPTGKACGDDSGQCAVPADVCASGWHACASSGKADDLRDRVSAQACAKSAGPGKFVAAMSHGQEQKICPALPGPDTVFPCWATGVCAEPVCCGDLCEFGMCKDSVWKGATRISRGTAEGCGKVHSANNGGILCCRDQIIAVPTSPPPGADSTASSSASAESKAADGQSRSSAGESPGTK